MKKTTPIWNGTFQFNQNQIKFLLFCMVLLSLIFSVGNLQAQIPTKGEIININYPHKTAFTDLNGSLIKVGDIVEIRKDGNLITYLTVSQTTTAISKLVPVIEEGPFKTKISFEDLSVGSEVLKIRSSQNSPDVVMPVQNSKKIGGENEKKDVLLNVSFIRDGDAAGEEKGSLEAQIKDLSQNYTMLSNNLDTIIEEKKVLIAENEQLKDRLVVLTNKAEDLEIQNQAYEAKIENMEKPVVASCQEEQKKIHHLEKVIELLKQKLLKIQLMIEGK